LLLLLSLYGCVVEAPLPYLGDCASYPEGIYEYGQIDIGTCLSGPTELRFAEDADGNRTLLVTNANPYLNFTGGSLLAIPWDEVDLTSGRNVISEMAVTANPLGSFAGPIALADEDQLALVGVRFSEGARTRVYDDRVHLFDITDPMSPTPADRGPDGAETVTVQSDPVDIAYDPATGYAFVANRTDHTISVLNTNGEELSIILPWPAHALSAATFSDADSSGSTATLADLLELDSTFLIDETWTLSWIAGTWRLWIPEDGGLLRLTTAGDGRYSASSTLELPAEDSTLYEAVVDPFYLYTAAGNLYFTDGERMLTASPQNFSIDWGTASVLLNPMDGSTINGPSVVIDSNLYWMFFGEDDGTEGVIRLATSGSATAGFTRSGIAIAPSLDHEGDFIGQPFVSYDVQTDQWRMYYSAFDGERWTIGYAVSDDLLTWSRSETPIFSLDGEDVGAPAVSFQAGAYQMWFARSSGDGEWTHWHATSEDGLSWSPTQPVYDTPVLSELPTRAALLASPNDLFRVSGEMSGTLPTQMAPGVGTAFADYGWAATPLAGMQLDTGASGAASTGGIRIDTADADAGLFWTTLTTTGGLSSIGAGYWEADGSLTPISGSILEGGADYDQDGVSSPVVWDQDGTWYMAYGARQGSLTSIALATSADGFTWERVGQIYENGESWDSLSAVPSSIEVLEDGQLRLWYAGDDGNTWRVGALVSSDGLSWSQSSTEPLLLSGSAGSWDDSGVRQPYIISDADGDLTGEPGTHMWYSGFDGSVWRIGYAFQPTDQETWERAEDPVTELKRPVIDERVGLFHPSGVERPVVSLDDDGKLTVWYAGRFGETERVGRATGIEPDRFYKTPLRPTVGDTFTFQTQRGDSTAEAIPLDNQLLGISLVGIGLTALDLDEERGFLYVSSKLLPYITVIDIRDDSTEAFDDLNYLDVEAVLLAKAYTADSGFRQVVAMPGMDTLYALNDAPESIMILDVSELVDDAYPDLLYDTQIGWLPAPTADLDAGVLSRSDVGPAQLVVHPDGKRLLATNFNANSITVYDLGLGPYGTMIAEIPMLGENPYALELTPDGRHAVFGNYSGEINDALVESTIGVLDIDPESPTYLSVLTWIANR
jgi:predicted GH43/DUF377 family glycosyl hydrolase